MQVSAQHAFDGRGPGCCDKDQCPGSTSQPGHRTHCHHPQQRPPPPRLCRRPRPQLGGRVASDPLPCLWPQVQAGRGHQEPAQPPGSPLLLGGTAVQSSGFSSCYCQFSSFPEGPPFPGKCAAHCLQGVWSGAASAPSSSGAGPPCTHPRGARAGLLPEARTQAGRAPMSTELGHLSATRSPGPPLSQRPRRLEIRESALPLPLFLSL